MNTLLYWLITQVGKIIQSEPSKPSHLFVNWQNEGSESSNCQPDPGLNPSTAQRDWEAQPNMVSSHVLMPSAQHGLKPCSNALRIIVHLWVMEAKPEFQPLYSLATHKV